MIRAQVPWLIDRFGVQVVQTWAGIASELGKGISTVQFYAKLKDDPLPVTREDIGGLVWIRRDDLADWAKRRGMW